MTYVNWAAADISEQIAQDNQLECLVARPGKLAYADSGSALHYVNDSLWASIRTGWRLSPIN